MGGCGSLPTEDDLTMAEEEILQQLDEMKAKLDEVRAGDDDPPAGAPLAEDERERQHQEDLQRL
jgi:hypothetical protein